MRAGVRMKILILGGYGTFGGRLARLLLGRPELDLVIAGRSLPRAKAFCRSLGEAACCSAVVFDRDAAVDTQLAAIRPDLLVDASGPFQVYGADPYRVVRACIGARVHYLDLADGADFVDGIAQFDGAARARGLYLLSGASSFPVLTLAVVRRLAQGLDRVERVTGGIAPSPYAGVGRNVIRALASYGGKPVPLRRDGRDAVGDALIEAMRYTIAPPGCLPLRNLRFSLVEVPELRILPRLWPQLQSVWIGAGPVPEILHRLLNGMAWLVRVRLLPSLLPFAGLFHQVISVLRWGEHRGGMFVTVAGRDGSGRVVERSWHLLAEGGEGPYIPSMAAQGMILRQLAGHMPAPGARPAAGALDLDDYDALFRGRDIHTGVREFRAEDAALPLYWRLLGPAWEQLPLALRVMHGWSGSFEARGRAQVERGGSLLSRCIAALFGFPRAGVDVPLTVSFSVLSGGGERWRRNFAGRSFVSEQRQGHGRNERLLVERFGPFAIALALLLREAQLHLQVRGWSLFGMPLPRWLAPRGTVYESAREGRFHFHVEIRAPLAGLLVRYRGWLLPEVPDAAVEPEASQSSHSRPSR